MSDRRTHWEDSDLTHTKRHHSDGSQGHHPATSGVTPQAGPHANHDLGLRIPSDLSHPHFLQQLDAFKVEVKRRSQQGQLKDLAGHDIDYKAVMRGIKMTEQHYKDAMETAKQQYELAKDLIGRLEQEASHNNTEIEKLRRELLN